MPLVERVRGTRCTAEPVLILPSLPPLEEQTFPSGTIRHCWRWSSASRGSKSMILEVSDISVQEIRDSLTAVWEELLNKNNCKQAHHGKQRFLFHLGNYIYIYLIGWNALRYWNTVPEHWVNDRKTEEKKTAWVAHRSTMDFIVTCGGTPGVPEPHSQPGKFQRGRICAVRTAAL